MHCPTNVYNFYININTGNSSQSPPLIKTCTGITTGMLLLMWKILFMNFYLSTTSECSRVVLEILLSSRMRAVPYSSQVQEQTHICTFMHSHLQDRHTSVVFFKNIFWTASEL